MKYKRTAIFELEFRDDLRFWVKSDRRTAIISRRNLRLGRSNREGALRVGIFSFVIQLIALLLLAKHIPFLEGETRRVFEGCAFSLWDAAIMWMFYLSLEPPVRRYWPDGLISWNRLLAGRWRDPLVGWHVLCGVGCALALTLTLRVGFFGKAILGNHERDRTSDRLVAGVPKEAFCAAVPAGDDPVQILADDRVVGRVDNGG